MPLLENLPREAQKRLSGKQLIDIQFSINNVQEITEITLIFEGETFVIAGDDGYGFSSVLDVSLQKSNQAATDAS